jgi:hypothetical protein
MNVHLHIDELVLHGFAPGDRLRIADAVQVELARLFTDGGVPPALTSGVAVDRMNAGAFHTAIGARPEATGAGIAQAVYGTMANVRPAQAATSEPTRGRA